MPTRYKIPDHVNTILKSHRFEARMGSIAEKNTKAFVKLMKGSYDKNKKITIIDANRNKDCKNDGPIRTFFFKDAKEHSWGFYVEPAHCTNNQWRVWNVEKNSQAFDHGVQSNWIISHINGIRLNGTNFEKYKSKLIEGHTMHISFLVAANI